MAASASGINSIDIAKMAREQRKYSIKNHEKHFFGEVIKSFRHKDLIVARIDQGRPNEVYVSAADVRAQPGDIVEGELVIGSGSRPRGRLQRVLRANSPADLACNVSLQLEGVPRDWPASIDTANIPSSVDAQVSGTRVDLQEMPLVTIDGADARDFDDAVYCEQEGHGWRLVVAIADVAHYVEFGGDIDVEAYRRGTSVYLPGRVIPMLPVELSNGICSLVPGQDRLAMVCDMHLDNNGKATSSKFYEAVIKSHARLTYGDVTRFLRNGDEPSGGKPVRKSLTAFFDAFRAMSKLAQARGSLDFETVETVIELQNGHPQRVVPIERHASYRMIELAMIAANEQAALFLERHRDKPLYRVHEPPDVWDMRLVFGRLAAKGVTVPGKLTKPIELQRVLLDIRKVCDPAYVWEVMLLSTMQQAHYAPNKLGHFGLALESYVHFTSPIRRYPDLVVHRALKSVLNGSGESALNQAKLEEVGNETSICERRAINAERRVQGWLKALLLKKRIGENFQGVVTGVRHFGLFVELADCYISGLLHVSRLPSDYFDFVAGELRGSRTGRTFQLGDELVVRLIGVQVATGKLDLELA